MFMRFVNAFCFSLVWTDFVRVRASDRIPTNVSNPLGSEVRIICDVKRLFPYAADDDVRVQWLKGGSPLLENDRIVNFKHKGENGNGQNKN